MKKKEDMNTRIRKNIFWQVFLASFFLAGVFSMLLSKYSWFHGIYVLFIFILAIGAVIMLPDLIYIKFKDHYELFEAGFKGGDAREKAKYNIYVFVILALIAYPIANAVNYYVFHGDGATNLTLMVFFDIIALFLSVKITNKKTKKE